ncbi:MAG: 50S ribosomal protein L10 [Candidatus Coatesbacteria bacterium RBG_13_66_14]|uniref:Large ribosomal subunit protein uL10 n=1 Tax=Candidatus Coatesbacteria bacterium RBG_13_66_14 TaxID=1817816 RepID=A0A1F5FHC7_9BACT|nr:MAG: 50S ribosomal protein L10 [Candidatus Coatesbacteria bacterium RBG_13_66_14]
MTREEKRTVVAELTQTLSAADCALFVNMIGQTVAETTELRRRVRGSDSSLRQVKNTLTRLALTELGREAALHLLDGPTALATTAHPVELSRALVAFTKDYEDKLQIRGGWLFDKILDSQGVVELSKCPPMPEMRARTLGLFTAPMANFLSLLSQVPAKFVRVLAAKAAREG